MSMKKTFHGTSKTLQSMQSTRMAGSVLRHVPSAGGAAAVDGIDDSGEAAAGEGAADVHFTTSCLCGSATTSHGCLSMIYGSFICACEVCARFTGAPHGVEWLHLPELTAGLSALLPAPQPATTGASTPTAGTGAAAATALRAQSGGAATSTAAVGGRNAASNARTSASASATASGAGKGEAAAAPLTQAHVRAYEHHCSSTALSTSSRIAEHGGGGGGDAVVGSRASGSSQGRTSPTTASNGSAATAVYVIYSCLMCGSLVGMKHDGVEGLLVPKLTLDVQSLEILSSCAQTVDLDASGMA